MLAAPIIPLLQRACSKSYSAIGSAIGPKSDRDYYLQVLRASFFRNMLRRGRVAVDRRPIHRQGMLISRFFNTSAIYKTIAGMPRRKTIAY